jgi:hypothetical protein
LHTLAHINHNMKKVFVLALVFCFFGMSRMYASHAQGADLSYRFVSYNTATGDMKYIVTVAFYRDCSGIPAPTTMPLSITDTLGGGVYDTMVNLPLINGLPCPYGGLSGATGCEVSQLCPTALAQSSCSGAAQYPGVQKYVYEDTISLPGYTPNHFCLYWVLSISITARNPSTNLANASANSLYIEAIINNSIDPVTGHPIINSTTIFTNDPVPFVCINSPENYNHGAVEPDGDSLVYALVTPLGGHGQPLAFNAGYTQANPITTANNFFFNPVNGQINFTPSQTEVDATAFVVFEYRHGVLVGSTMRDVQVNVIICSARQPVIAKPQIIQDGFWSDSNTISVCPGSHLITRSQVSTQSSNGLLLSSSIQSAPAFYPGMIFTQSGSGYTQTATVEWVNADSGCRYVFLNALTGDCPVGDRTSYGYRICVNNKVHIFAGTTTYCGQPILLTASGGNNPVWTPVTGLSNNTGDSTYATPAVNTLYHYLSSCGSDSITIRSEPSVIHTITHDTTVCNGVPVPLRDMVQGSGIYSYAWSPSIGLYDPANTGSIDTSISNPVFLSGKSQVYHCLITDTMGCVIEDSVGITVRGRGTLFVRGDSSVLIGTAAHLVAGVTPVYNFCTTISSPVNTKDSVQIGTGTTIQTGPLFLYPSPYGNYYKSARHQILIHAAELTALFSGSRIISSFSLDIGTLTSTVPLKNFTIRLGCTAEDSLMKYIPEADLHEVFNPKTVVPMLGWNKHIFDQPYIWDGVSNLVVDICFTDSTNTNANNKLVYTYTPYQSIYWTFSNQYSMCGVTGSQPSSSPASYAFQRPDIKFGLAENAALYASLTWQPATGINAVANDTSQSTTAYPYADQWYTATIADPACPLSDSVLVRVRGSYPHHPVQDTVLCSGDSVRLAAYGGGSYIWSDRNGTLSLDSAFYFNTTVSDSVYLSITDSAGRIYTDTTYVTVPVLTLSVRDTTICGGDTLMLSAGGMASYIWVDSTATISTSGSLALVPSSSLSLIVTGTTLGCSLSDTSYIHVLSQKVWPGDANNDDVVDISDFLYLGVGFGATGPARPLASIVWTGQCTDAWSSTFPGGVNYAHADCNGDGVIGFDDTTAVFNNWGYVHAKQDDSRSSNYNLYITTDKLHYNISDSIHATISVGYANRYIPNLYGIAYQFEIFATGTIIGVSQSGSWLTPKLKVTRPSTSTQVDIAQSRVNHTDSTGYGVIGTITTKLSGSLQADSIYLLVNHITAVDKTGNPIIINSYARTVTAYPLGVRPIDNAGRINMYPNPNTGMVRIILGSNGAVNMTLSDAIGRNVYDQLLSEKINTIDLAKLSDGIYTISFTSSSVNQVEKMVISR